MTDGLSAQFRILRHVITVTKHIYTSHNLTHLHFLNKLVKVQAVVLQCGPKYKKLLGKRIV